MSQIALAGLDGQQMGVDVAAVQLFGRSLHGDVIGPSSPEYHASRAVWNAMIDKYPALIVRCTEPSDICNSVKFANQHGLLISVRSGGHNIAGNAVCHGGMMLDLSKMKMVRFDTQTNTAMANPAATLGEFDAAIQPDGYATPVGINSTTGLAGLTLGGGFGWISRKFGLTIDNLRSARIVTASGEMVTANSMENTDLFWGIRGGGGNFGIAASFTYKLHHIGHEVFSGLIVHPFDAAPDAMRFYREFCKTAPDDVTVWCVMRKAPPLPFLPAEWHGKLVLVFAVCAVGDFAAAEAALAPLRQYGKPIADVVGPHKYLDWQQAFDPLLTAGARNYWKTNNFVELSDGAIDALIESVRSMAGDHSEIFVGQLGGATSRVAEDATAYRDRSAQFVMNVHGRWMTMEEDKPGIAWCRSAYEATKPFATGGAYVNFMTMEEGGRVADAYGGSYEKLRALKAKWDPKNLFRMNQNIAPS